MENEQNKIKIVLIGGENSGKTKFYEYLRNNNQDIDFSNYQTTSGASYMSKNIIYKKFCYLLDVWDTSGQEKYDALTKFFYIDADIIFIFFIYNSKNSFQRAKTMFQSVKYDNHNHDVVIALIGNKYDEDKKCLRENDHLLHEEEIFEFVDKNNLIFGHLSIKEKYSNGIIEIFMKAMNEYIKKKKKNIYKYYGFSLS